MKKKVLAIALVTVFTGTGVAQAADVTAQAVATWSATAKKDTTSKLVVTPLGSLAFQYAEGIKGFNSQKGLFVLGGNLSPLANGYNASNRTTAQDGFTFSIISGTTNGTTAVTDYSTLPEGIWSGDVSVQFDATWTS